MGDDLCKTLGFEYGTMELDNMKLDPLTVGSYTLFHDLETGQDVPKVDEVVTVLKGYLQCNITTEVQY
jgi:hypothetical protein